MTDTRPPVQPADPGDSVPHKQPRLLWFVTFVTHNSRISERIVTYGVQVGEPLCFSPAEQVQIAGYIIDICHRHQIALCALNILPDHVHVVLAAYDQDELNDRVRKIKGYSAYAFNKGIRLSDKGTATSARMDNSGTKVRGNGLKPVVQAQEPVQSANNGLQPIAQSSHSNQPVWAQKFHSKLIKSQSELEAVLNYVWTNHEKHAERWGQGLLDTWNNGLKPVVEATCVPPEDAVEG